MHPDLPRYVVELFEALLQVGLYAGVPRALNAIRVLREVEGEAS